MNGKRAKEVRREAERICGSQVSGYQRTKHPDLVILGLDGREVMRIPRYTDVGIGFKRTCQALKRQWGLRR